MKTLLMFPGQGSQYIGMGKDIYENYNYSKKAFDIVDNALNEKLTDLIFNGNEEELKKSYNSQPALMLVSVAIYLALKEEYGDRLETLNIQGVSGHSLGEYSALCVSGCMTIDETSKILKKRGQAMFECVDDKTGMCAIIGSDKDVIQDSINNIKSKCLVIANNNSIGQIVVSGYLEDIKKLKHEMNGKVKKMIDLPVSGAFHSPLMQKAQDIMSPIIKNISIHKPNLPVLQNYSGKFENEVENIKINLINQITSPVLWYENIQYAIANGFDTFIEIGAKNILSGLVKRCIKTEEQIQKIKILNIEKVEDVKTLFNKLTV